MGRYNVGRWGVYKTTSAKDPIAFLVDGRGVALELDGPLYNVVNDRLEGPVGANGPLAPVGESGLVWIVNYTDHDHGYVLRPLCN